MDKDKITSSAKALKIASVAIALACLVLALLSLFYKNEDPEAKKDMLFFAMFGLLGLGLLIIGYGESNILTSLAEVKEKEAEDDDDEILA